MGGGGYSFDVLGLGVHEAEVGGKERGGNEEEEESGSFFF